MNRQQFIAGLLIPATRFSNPINATYINGLLTKTGVSNSWDAGINSLDLIENSTNPFIGLVKFVLPFESAHRFFGLNSNGRYGITTGYGSMNFAIYLSIDNGMYIYEDGVSSPTPIYTATTEEVVEIRIYNELRDSIVKPTVSYWINGIRKNTSSKNPIFPTYLDALIYTQGGRIKGMLQTTTSP